MNQNYTTNNLNPSEKTLDIIRQYARTFRPMHFDGKVVILSI